MTADDWLDALRERLPGVAGTADAHPSAPTGDEVAALLDLARVAAHTAERWTAPISTFLAGVAYATTDPQQRAIALRALVADLEDGTDGT